MAADKNRRKMNVTAIRQELKDYIDALPDANLEAVRPILRSYADEDVDDGPLIYETDLTEEDMAVILRKQAEKALDRISESIKSHILENYA